MPQRDVATVQQPPPCITLDPPQKPDSQIPQPTSHDSQPPSSSYAAPNHVKELAADPLQPPQLSASFVESDEEIARLLEDIMMGLNILPNLERDDEKSNDMSATHNRGVDPVPIMECAGQSQMDTAVTTEGCVFNQDFSTQNSHPSTSTPTHTGI